MNGIAVTIHIIVITMAVLLLSVQVVRAQSCTRSWYADTDGDGFGNVANDVATACTASAPAGYVANSLDCTDSSPQIPAWKESSDLIFDMISSNDATIMFSADSALIAMMVDLGGATSVARYDNGAWSLLGNEGFAASSTLVPGSAALAVSTNTPYVSYVDGNAFSVYRYTGTGATGWQTVGTINDVPGNLSSTDLGTDGSGRVYLATSDGTNAIRVRMLNGSTWSAIGGTPVVATGTSPRIAFDSNGVLYLAYADNNGYATVQRFNGTTWSVTGSASFSGFIEKLMLKVDRTNVPYVAYFDLDLYSVVVQKYDGTDWTMAGSNTIFSGYAVSVSLDVGIDNIPYIGYAYFDAASGYAVKKLNSSDNWETVIADPLTTDLGEQPLGGDISIAIAPDEIPWISIHKSDGTGEHIGVFSVAPFGCVLPVEIASFKAAAKEHTVSLSWRTLSEQNLGYFIVERSQNGKDFSDIGKVTAYGNSMELRHYAFTDKAPVAGRNYYRLRAVDYDGSFKHSRITTAVMDDDMGGRLFIYPNPNAGNFLYYRTEFEPQVTDQIRVINILGKIVYQSVIQDEPGIDFGNGLPTGSYILQYISAHGVISTRLQVIN